MSTIEYSAPSAFSPLTPGLALSKAAGRSSLPIPLIKTTQKYFSETPLCSSPQFLADYLGGAVALVVLQPLQRKYSAHIWRKYGGTVEVLWGFGVTADKDKAPRGLKEQVLCARYAEHHYTEHRYAKEKSVRLEALTHR